MKHTRRSVFCVLCIVLGLAGVSVAMGLLYRDVSLTEQAIAKLAIEEKTSYKSLDEDAVFKAWAPAYWLGALGAGTLGVMLLGAGVTIFLYDLPGLMRDAREGRPPSYDPP